MLPFPFFFLRTTVSNGEILQDRASLQHNSYSGRAEDSDLEVSFNFPDSWLPITITSIIPLLQFMDIGHLPKSWTPCCYISVLFYLFILFFAFTFFHFEYLCSTL